MLAAFSKRMLRRINCFLMKNLSVIILFILFIISCSLKNKRGETGRKYNIADFYDSVPELDSKVKMIFNELTDHQRVAQMIIQAAGRLGKPDDVIDDLIEKKSLGGVLLLNGTKDDFKRKIKHFDSLTEINGLLPLVYSADAEPSLINRKIEGTTPVPKTIELKSLNENERVAEIISKDLLDIGIQYDYAPVLDIGHENAAIKNRSYGNSKDSVVMLTTSFVETLQKNGIAATVKHFPGHGLVTGDTHSQLVYIDGPMQEVTLYEPLIKAGVLSIMVGHIAVKNNPDYDSEGLPASCSRKIVTDLLRNQMGFKGIITKL